MTELPAPALSPWRYHRFSPQTAPVAGGVGSSAVTDGERALGVAEVKRGRTGVKWGGSLYLLLLGEELIITQLPRTARAFGKWMQQVRVCDA